VNSIYQRERFASSRSAFDMAQPTIFVVEDDDDIARLIQLYLEGAGFAVRVFHLGSEALAGAAESPPNLFILDIMLPDGDGLELCKRIHSRPNLAGCRIIFVSAKTSEADRVVGLELGADDYIVKPFSPRELVARVKAVFRRTQAEPTSVVLNCGALQVDLNAMTVFVRGDAIYTTTTEFRLLEVLIRSSGRVIARQRLLELIWGSSRNVDPRSVDVYISRLREKIEQDPKSPRYLQTMRGVGYRFVAHTEEEEPPNPY
jgi:DNA-binding response OmpR family regulator